MFILLQLYYMHTYMHMFIFIYIYIYVLSHCLSCVIKSALVISDHLHKATSHKNCRYLKAPYFTEKTTYQSLLGL